MAPEENFPCPLCGNGSPKAFVRAWREYRLYDCLACGAGFCLPFKNPGSEYYAKFEDLYPHQAQETTDPMTLEFDECLDFLARRGPAAGKSLLDVGCGAGGFLNRAKQRGFAVSGVDFNKARLELIKTKLGIPSVFAGSVEDFAKANPSARFDAVTMFQVLEHLDAPARWLETIFSLLKPGGHLIIGVPNRDRTFEPFTGVGMEDVDNPPNHLTYWRAPALRHFVEGRGFRVIEARALDIPRPLLALLLRNRLRFGLATRTLGVDQLQHLPKEECGETHKAWLIQSLVGAKEFLINAAAAALYPVFQLTYKLSGWQGVVLYCVAQKP